MRSIAIIPARGGSKGIPGKNLKKINGSSLLQRAIEAAHRSATVTEVFVTSDAPEILREAERHGAGTIHRPIDLASDTASSESALLHALDELEARGIDLDIVVFLQCTSPFISPDEVDGVVAQIVDKNADCALTVTPFHGFLWRPESLGLSPLGHEKDSRPRRQDREPVFLETGAAYAMRADQFRREKHRFFGVVGQHVVSQKQAVEIDEPVDLEIAKILDRGIRPPNLNDLPIAQVGALLLDFDGVLTDDLAIVDQHGKESVTVSRSDGMGIERLKKLSNIEVFVISKETNPVVAARCRKLNVPCLHGVENKAVKIQAWANDKGIALSEIVFVGNDLNDLPVFPLIGLSVAPADAFDSVRSSADIVLSKSGGRGAVREICERLIKQFGSTNQSA